jgi:transposase
MLAWERPLAARRCDGGQCATPALGWERRLRTHTDARSVRCAEPGLHRARTWLEQHPRWRFHFTPTHASWLNQIELFFSILSRRLLKRGVFSSTADLEAQLLAFIERYNPTAKPFAWTYAGKPLTK